MMLASLKRITEHASSLDAATFDLATNFSNWMSASEIEDPSKTIPTPHTATYVGSGGDGPCLVAHGFCVERSRFTATGVL
jgi:hypothetical protein